MYAAAGYEPEDPPEAGAADIAIAIYGHRVLKRWDGIGCDVSNGSILVGRHACQRRAHFGIAVAVVRLWLAEGHWRPSRPELERRAAAWLVAPPEAIRAQLWGHGYDVRRLADRLRITETCASLRIGEVMGGAVVTTPATVHRRGDLLSGLDDRAVREVAAAPRPGGLVRVRLSDEAARVALFSRQA